ncbi:uroporphyrinogen-III synthase [Nautilia lithotrophica]
MENAEIPVYLLTDQKVEGVLNYPVIKINFLSPSFTFENIDYLIFTSKNGVRAVNYLTDEWKKYPSLAIGKATANEIEKLGGRVEYIAKSAYGDEFAKEINQTYNNKTFLFFRAKKLVSNIQKEFVNNTLKEVIIYETNCNNPQKEFIKPSVVIFTSPSTVRCFSKLNDFKNIKAVAIGNKTKKELSKHTTEIFMPSTPSINECVKLAKSLKLR